MIILLDTKKEKKAKNLILKDILFKLAILITYVLHTLYPHKHGAAQGSLLVFFDNSISFLPFDFWICGYTYYKIINYNYH